jgi:hypothetical protein
MEPSGSSSPSPPSPQQSFDRNYKLDCLKEILAQYHLFLNIPNHPEDARLVFFLTLCRLIDRAASLQPTVAELVDEPIDFPGIRANEERLFRRYRFDERASERENLERYVDALLDAPADSTARFL